MTWTISVSADTLEAAVALFKAAPAPPPKPPTLVTLIAAATDGKLVLPGGTMKDTAALPNAITLSGAGIGKTIIDCTGLRPTNDKAVLVVQAAGCVISDMTLRGAAIAPALGNNAAGMRDNGPGVGFTLRNVEITGCQMGILTFPSNVLINQCMIHDNGASDGRSHEIYLDGVPATMAIVSDTTVMCGPLSSHALKSRAGTTSVLRSKLTGTPSAGAANGGSVIDCPNGGVLAVEDTDITIAPGAANHMFIGYGMESTNFANAAIGNRITLTNVRLHGNGVAGSIETKIPGATLNIGDGCTFDGPVTPALIGWAAGSVSGAFRAA